MRGRKCWLVFRLRRKARLPSTFGQVPSLRECDECARRTKLLAKARDERIPRFGFEFGAIEKVSLRPVARGCFKGCDLQSHGGSDQGATLKFRLKAIPQKSY